MSIQSLLAEGEAFFANLKAHLSPAVQAEIKTVENEGHAIVQDAVSYIKTNGLQDLEQLALTVVAAMIPGASWTGVLAGIKAQAVTDGIKILEGAEGVVAAKVQADLLAAGKPAGLPTA